MSEVPRSQPVTLHRTARDSPEPAQPPPWKDRPCPECKGEGYLWVDGKSGLVSHAAACTFCRSKGVVDVD